jgi:hypothetical protein
MSGGNVLDYQTVLEAIRAWPAGQRLTLIQELLTTLAAEVAMGRLLLDDAAARRREGLRRPRGIGATGAPPPSDAEVAEWLEAERVKKYG